MSIAYGPSLSRVIFADRIFLQLFPTGAIAERRSPATHNTVDPFTSSGTPGRKSYTDVGRYHTLQDIPVTVQVEQASDGRTHDELQRLLRVRVHKTLLDLLRQECIGREHLERVYLYISADPQRAARQVTARKELAESPAEILRVALQLGS